MFNPLGKTGRVIGSDFAGVVETLGDSVPAANGLKVGTTVAGFLQGACSINERRGALQEYLVCPWGLSSGLAKGCELKLRQLSVCVL